MRHLITGMAAAAAFALAACEAETPPEPTVSGNEVVAPKPAVTSSDVARETAQAAETVGAYTKQRADEFIRASEQQLDELDQSIASLREKADQAGDKVAEATQRKIAELKEGQAEARRQLGALKTAGADTWRDARQGMERTLGNLRDAYEAARGELSS